MKFLKFLKFWKRVQKIPWLISVIEIWGCMTEIIRKMTEKSTCELTLKASYYNYSYCCSTTYKKPSLGETKLHIDKYHYNKYYGNKAQTYGDSALWAILSNYYRLRQIIDLFATDKSRYFAITEFKSWIFFCWGFFTQLHKLRSLRRPFFNFNSFIIQSLSLFFNK